MKNRKHSFVKLALTSLGIIHVVNKWIDSSSTSKQTLSSNGTYFHWKHGDIFYKKVGNGSNPLLLVHDLTPFNASFEWNEILDLMKDEFTIYIPDLPGCGKSDKPAMPFTSYYFVQMITDFVKDVIGTSTNIAATGLSGSFTLMADQLNPELFRQIILINPKSLGQLKKQPDNHSRALQILFDLPFIGTTAYYMITSHVNMEYYWTEKKVFNPFCIDRRLLKASYDAAHGGNGFGKYLLGSVDGNYLNVNITKALSSITTPLHLIFGAQVSNYHETLTEYRKLNDNISAEIMADCMMYPQIEAPEDLTESLYIVLGYEKVE